MRRRNFIAMLGGAAMSWPFGARAQQPAKPRRMAYLGGRASNDLDEQRRVHALTQALEQVGWTDGGNIRIDHRWAAGDSERAQALAKELVSLAPDVIVAGITQALTPLRHETQTIPIVFVAIPDPVGQGIVSNLAHPGGNVTGFTSYDPAMGTKWLEVLKQVAPGVTQVAFLVNPDTSRPSLPALRAIEVAAPSFAVLVTTAFVHDIPGIEKAFTALAREPNSGLIVAIDSFTLLHRELIATLAAQHRLPAVYGLHEYATSGGLIAYGPDIVEQYRLAAGYVDRILRGANPGDLPVQDPTKFELFINLKAAKALGLTVPLTLLAVADKVIE